MTTVMASFLAIVLFGMVMLATISYGDALGMRAAPDSVVIGQRLQSAAELVSQIETGTGSRPHTAQELFQAGMPSSTIGGAGELQVECTGSSAASVEACTPLTLCVALPGTSENVSAARATADRIHGAVSGECGSAVPPGEHVVVSLTI